VALAEGPRDFLSSAHNDSPLLLHTHVQIGGVEEEEEEEEGVRLNFSVNKRSF